MSSPYYMSAESLTPRKEICNYFAGFPVYALAWSRREDRGAFRMAVSSFSEEPSNSLQVVQLSPQHDASHIPERTDFGVVAATSVDYPLSKIQWQPGLGPDLVAGVGDALHIWECEMSGEMGDMGLSRGRLRARTKLTTRADYAAPITSMDWNTINPRLVLTSSIDTTCTLWDVETQQAKTQLIAHDREVFDVSFVAGSQDVFVSAGADGSVRMFDLRALEHSTILYEAPAAVAPSTDSLNDHAHARLSSFTPPLLRLSCNAVDPNYIATFALDSNRVSIVDVRNPGAAVAQLCGHQAPVHAISWSPTSPTQLCSAGADSRVLVWDIHQALSARQHQQRQAVAAAAQAKHLGRISNKATDAPSIHAAAHAAAAHALAQQPVPVAPSLTYAARLPVNSLAWHQSSPEWISIAFGSTVQTLRL
ncbi:hypothetical protein LPJ79_001310 [Coemansia sp. RSA 1821]|nr:hypothetical protein LPJ68_000795 [Coemansia sp. RSA 1086]KAJ1752347.1 hypothetical protein LPJ79_001310 [Coemansia sp. RSA 1821]